MSEERTKEEATEQADDFKRVWRGLGMLNSMVRGGEMHSDESCRVFAEALESLERIEERGCVRPLGGRTGEGERGMDEMDETDKKEGGCYE